MDTPFTDNRSRFRSIVQALVAVSKEIPVVWPVHPRTKKLLDDSDIELNRLRLIDPVSYLGMIDLEKNAALIATDSGGVQKEAFFYKVPCVTLRDETEWVETVESGWNTICSPSVAPSEIVDSILPSIGIQGRSMQPYGDGDASTMISACLSSSAR